MTFTKATPNTPHNMGVSQWNRNAAFKAYSAYMTAPAKPAYAMGGSETQIGNNTMNISTGMNAHIMNATETPSNLGLKLKFGSNTGLLKTSNNNYTYEPTGMSPKGIFGNKKEQMRNENTRKVEQAINAAYEEHGNNAVRLGLAPLPYGTALNSPTTPLSRALMNMSGGKRRKTGRRKTNRRSKLRK
jgi:hypothetical protein